MSDDVNSIIFGSIQVVSTIAAVTFMDKAGRKTLLIVSSAVMTIALGKNAEFVFSTCRSDQIR